MTADPRLSAYGYDPRPAIEAWRAGQVVDGPQELWEKLYHQGTVNSASYAAVGEIVRMMQGQSDPDWNAYALIASIEEGRLTDGSPPVPLELRQGYEGAWAAILPMAIRDLGEAEDDLIVRSTLAVIPYAKGKHTLVAIALRTEDEREEMLAG